MWANIGATQKSNIKDHGLLDESDEIEDKKQFK